MERRLTRRAFAGLLLVSGATAALGGDRWRGAGARVPPAPIAHADLARYLRALADLPPAPWAHLALTASVMEPDPGAIRALAGWLPAGNLRGRINGWTYRAEAGRMRSTLEAVARAYATLLPPDRALFYGRLIADERRRLAAGGQIDYRGLAHLVTGVNRERGLMARVELDHLELVRQHRLDPIASPRDVAALLAERAELRELAARFRAETIRLLAGAPQAAFATPAGPLTLLADLGTPATPPRGYQLIRDHLPNLRDDTIRARQVYFTAGDFLAVEPPAPPGRWADGLPEEQRALAPTNALSPRLRREDIIAPEHTSRVLWPPLADCRALVADLRRLSLP